MKKLSFRKSIGSARKQKQHSQYDYTVSKNIKLSCKSRLGASSL